MQPCPPPPRLLVGCSRVRLYHKTISLLLILPRSSYVVLGSEPLASPASPYRPLIPICTHSGGGLCKPLVLCVWDTLPSLCTDGSAQTPGYVGSPLQGAMCSIGTLGQRNRCSSVLYRLYLGACSVGHLVHVRCAPASHSSAELQAQTLEARWRERLG